MIEIASTTNPIFRNFPAPFSFAQATGDAPNRMTLTGALEKAVLLSVCSAIFAIWIWWTLSRSTPKPTDPLGEHFFLLLLFVSALAPFVLVGISVRRKDLSRYIAPIYAVLQGVFFGFVSVALEPRLSGVVIEIFCLTFTMYIWLAIAYGCGVLEPTDHFKRKLLFAACGILPYFAVAFMLSWMGDKAPPMVFHGPGAVACGAVVIIAGITFIHEFEMAVKTARQNHLAYMEWHAALGLTISLVWLYLEGLRFFIKDRIPPLPEEA